MIPTSSTAEAFTPAERARLAPYFTNLDGHVFALTNLPETVKGALFARYSRSAKSLRRLFLDEFSERAEDAERAEKAESVEKAEGAEAGPRAPAEHAEGHGRGLARAEKLYARVFNEYGDDSVTARRRAHRLRACLERADESARVGPADGTEQST